MLLRYILKCVRQRLSLRHRKCGTESLCNGETRLSGRACWRERSPRAVVCITYILAVRCREWPDVGRYRSLHSVGVAHAFGVEHIVIHDTDRPDWRIWSWSGLDYYNPTLSLTWSQVECRSHMRPLCCRESTVTPQAAERAGSPPLLQP